MVESGFALQPTSLKGAETSLRIEWNDGAVHEISWKRLRDACPCATCRDQKQNPAENESDLLPVLSVTEARPLKPTAMRLIGNYAYGIEFGDGHNTGIFSLELLRQLGESAD